MIKYVFLLILIKLSFYNAQGQFMRASQEKALDSLSKLKPLFKEAANDTAFVKQYSQISFRVYTFHRGDQAADIEEQIYAATPGEVVGPFRGYDSSNYLFKVLSFEEHRLRSRATLIIIKPNAESKQDTASIRKYAIKYSEAAKKGKDINELAEKDNVRLIYRELDWYYEGVTERDYYDVVMKSEKGDLHILDSVHGASILKVTQAKEKVPYKVKLTAVIRKG